MQYLYHVNHAKRHDQRNYPLLDCRYTLFTREETVMKRDILSQLQGNIYSGGQNGRI